MPKASSKKSKPVTASDFHIETELEGVNRTEQMAGAFETALRHAATDPMIRLKMILGETYADYLGVVDRLQAELAKENEAVNELAKKLNDNSSILAAEIGDHKISDVQQQFLRDVLAR